MPRIINLIQVPIVIANLSLSLLHFNSRAILVDRYIRNRSIRLYNKNGDRSADIMNPFRVDRVEKCQRSAGSARVRHNIAAVRTKPPRYRERRWWRIILYS